MNTGQASGHGGLGECEKCRKYTEIKLQAGMQAASERVQTHISGFLEKWKR